jgi:hypothetical protein
MMEAGTVALVGGTWTTVPLANTYTSPVVVASPRYANNSTPIVVRIQNVTATSFEIRLQNPSNGAVAAETVDYLVVEEGKWLLPDGTPIEAARVASDGTSANKAWSNTLMEAYTYQNSYTSPVVLGQVMTANDADWSVFWASNGAQRTPPTASACYVGKMVGEDPDELRAIETLGVIVIETASGSAGGSVFQSFVGADTVKGVVNVPPYSYSLSGFSSTPQVAIAVQAAMDGNEGSWAVLYGASPLSATRIGVAVDEDQLSDSERNHGSEQVAVLAIESAGSVALTPAP